MKMALPITSYSVVDAEFDAYLMTNDNVLDENYKKIENIDASGDIHCKEKRQFIIDAINQIIEKLKNKNFTDVSQLTISYNTKNKEPHFYHYSSNSSDSHIRLFHYSTLTKVLFELCASSRNFGRVYLWLMQSYPNKTSFFKQYPIIYNKLSEIERGLMHVEEPLLPEQFDMNQMNFQMELRNLLDTKFSYSFSNVLMTQLSIDGVFNDPKLFYNNLNVFAFGIYTLLPELYAYFSEHDDEFQNYKDKFDQINVGNSNETKKSLYIIYKLAAEILVQYRDFFEDQDIEIPEYIEQNIN